MVRAWACSGQARRGDRRSMIRTPRTRGMLRSARVLVLVKRSSIRRAAACAGLALALAATSATARAQSAKEIAAAKQAFKDGEAAEAKGELTTALARFRAAIAVKETAQLHLRIGSVQEKLGKLVDALASYKRGLDKAAGLPAVAKVAKEQIAALEPKIPTVVITVAAPPPGLAIKLDDAQVEAGSRAIDPGQHKVHAEAPGRAPFDRSFMVDRGVTRIEVELAPIVVAPKEEPRSKAPGVIAIVTGGLGVVGGAVLIGVSVSKDASIDELCGGSERLTCPASKRAVIESDVRAVNAMRFSGIGLGVAGAASVAMGTWLLAEARKPKEASSRWVMPYVGPGVVGMTGKF